MKKDLFLIKLGFTLIEIVIVLVVIGILMAVTMNFGSNRIVDLKAQSIKEQFVGRYNDIYSQNMTSSFRDGKKYQKLTLVMHTGVYYMVNDLVYLNDIAGFEIKNLRFSSDENNFSSATIAFTPYRLGCDISDGSHDGGALYFDLFIAENGKQYCFEILSETCKLIEIRCAE